MAPVYFQTHEASVKGARFVVPAASGNFQGVHTRPMAEEQARVWGAFGFWRVKNLHDEVVDSSQMLTVVSLTFDNKGTRSPMGPKEPC